MPPENKHDFLQNDYWTDHFLKFVEANQNPDSVTSPAVLQLYKAHSETFNATTPMTRERALEFVNGPLAELATDPEVNLLISGYSRQFSLDTLRDQLKDEQSYNQRGKNIVTELATKASYHIQSEYADYREWLKTPEGIASYKVPERPEVKVAEMPISDRSRETVQRVWQKASNESEITHQQAIDQLVKAGIAPEQAEAKLDQIRDYIREAPLTLNFRPSHDEVKLYESYAGRTPIWAAPQSIVDQTPGYSEKRARVENEKFGIEGNPYQHDDPSSYDAWGDRPVYASVNPGTGITGGSEQWGSSYFVLKDEVKERVTYTSEDTFAVSGVNHVGSPEHLDGVIADMAPDRLKMLNSFITEEKGVRSLGENKYLEAQIHGPVRWKTDIEKMVIDRSVVPVGSDIDNHLMRFAQDNGIKVEEYSFKEWQSVASMSEKEGGGVKVANANLQPTPVDVDNAIALAETKPLRVTPHLERRAAAEVAPMVQQRTELENKLKKLETKPSLLDRIKAIPSGGLDNVRQQLKNSINESTRQITDKVNAVYREGSEALQRSEKRTAELKENVLAQGLRPSNEEVKSLSPDTEAPETVDLDDLMQTELESKTELTTEIEVESKLSNSEETHLQPVSPEISKVTGVDTSQDNNTKQKPSVREMLGKHRLENGPRQKSGVKV